VTRPAPAAVRTTEILDYLASNPGERFTLSQIAKGLDINMASTLAILTALANAGYVHRHPVHKTYALGAALVAIGSAALIQNRAVAVANDVMAKLSHDVDAEALASVIVGDDIVIVAVAGRPRVTGYDVRVGQRVPMVPPLGGTFMAWASDERIERWLDELGDEASEEERNYFRETLAAIRKRGYTIGLESGMRAEMGSVLHDVVTAARDEQKRRQTIDMIAALRHDYEVVDLDQTKGYAISNMGAPIFDAEGEVILGISVQGFGSTMKVAEIQAVGDALMSAALDVTRRIGGHVPPW
jgi:DNA-binding IclR family transcriptional regulator